MKTEQSFLITHTQTITADVTAGLENMQRSIKKNRSTIQYSSCMVSMSKYNGIHNLKMGKVLLLRWENDLILTTQYYTWSDKTEMGHLFIYFSFLCFGHLSWIHLKCLSSVLKGKKRNKQAANEEFITFSKRSGKKCKLIKTPRLWKSMKSQQEF